MLLPIALTVAALLLLAVAGAALPGLLRWVHLGTAAICGVGFVLAIAALLAGGDASAALSLGGNAFGMHLALDALSATFLLPVFGAGTAAAFYAADQGPRTAPLLPLLLAGLGLAVLAADGMTLLLGFEGAFITAWGLVLANPPQEPGPPARLLGGMAVFGALCLAGAFGVLAAGGPASAVLDLRFATIRGLAPDGWRGTALLVLVLLGAGVRAGLVPLHSWLTLALPAAPSHVAALMAGAATKVAAYVLVRLLFDLGGVATPSWWGVPLILLGTASAVLGALRANLEAEMPSVLAAGTVKNMGLIAVGLGVALVARGSDLLPLAALATGGALLHMLGHAAAEAGLFLAAGSVQQGAGSQRLGRLGGLIHQMPRTATCVLLGCASLAALPPLAGFASLWLLLQSLLAAPRIGGLALQLLLALSAGLVALSAALAAAATVRLFGVAFLGRPRTPRAAAAQDGSVTTRLALTGLAITTVLIGLLPGPALMLCRGAVRLLTGAGLEERVGWFSVATNPDAAGYSAPAAALILLLAGLGIAALIRGRVTPGTRYAPAWDGGFAASPPWLPFGDPATQYGGLSAAQPVARSLGRALVGARENIAAALPGDPAPAQYALLWQDPVERWLHRPVLAAHAWLVDRLEPLHAMTVRRCLAAVFATLVLLLLAVAWLEAR